MRIVDPAVTQLGVETEEPTDISAHQSGLAIALVKDRGIESHRCWKNRWLCRRQHPAKWNGRSARIVTNAAKPAVGIQPICRLKPSAVSKRTVLR